MSYNIPLFQVDAFTNKPFSGNPAAVCLLEKPVKADWMQAVAAEMNLSETAFVWPLAKGGFSLRWFTPAVEVDLCGHATLATAHTLWQENWLKPNETAQFHSNSGILTAQPTGDKITLNFPATPAQTTDIPTGMLEALGLTKIEAVARKNVDYLLELEDETTLRKLQPDFTQLRQIECRGIIVTAISTKPEYDFVSRFFAPGAGIDEDPVTGSAHCTLAPYWAERLGKTEFKAFQASARGGELAIVLAGERVMLSGSAVTVLRGQLSC